MEFFRKKSKEWRERRAVNKLKKDLKNPQRSVQFQAAMALAEKGNQLGIGALVSFIDDNDKNISKTATKTLEKLGPIVAPRLTEIFASKISEFKKHEMRLNQPFFSSEEYRTRRFSEASLREIGLRSADRFILGVTTKPFLIKLMNLLVKIGDDRPLGLLKIAAERIEDEEIRTQAAQAVELIENPTDKL